MDWTTHQVFNQFPELSDYDPLASDPALCEALASRRQPAGRGQRWTAMRGGWAGPTPTPWRNRPTAMRPSCTASTRAGGASTPSSSTRPGTS